MHRVYHHCVLHSNNWTATWISKSVCEQWSEEIYCSTKFVGMGGRLMRLVYCASRLVQSNLGIITNQQPVPFRQRVAEGMVELSVLPHIKDMCVS